MEWTDSGHVWEAWTIALPSGILIYCDDDGEEARVLGSVRRGNAVEADGFFLELLAETRGDAFGIEMAGVAPDRVVRGHRSRTTPPRNDRGRARRFPRARRSLALDVARHAAVASIAKAAAAPPRAGAIPQVNRP